MPKKVQKAFLVLYFQSQNQHIISLRILPFPIFRTYTRPSCFELAAWARPTNYSDFGSKEARTNRGLLGLSAFELPNEMMQELNELSAVDLGFPHDFLAYPTVQEVLFGDNTKIIVNHHR